MRLLRHLSLLLLVILPAIVLLTHDRSVVTHGQEADDIIDEGDLEEDEDATVEADDDTGGIDSSLTEQDIEGEDEEEEEFLQLQPSPDAETNILFVTPANPEELPAGQLVKVLVGFVNHGSVDFIVNYMEASFRYPQDYTFHIQNFSLIEYQRVIEPGRQASFAYNFIPSDTFSARPFGLVINLNYKDVQEGNYYQDAVFNQTIQVVETEEGLDGETFFLYVFLAAVLVLLLVVGQQVLTSVGKKKLSLSVGGSGGGGRQQQAVEVGTVSGGDVDYDWIPKESLTDINKSPKAGKTSPRNRRTKRSEAD